MVPRGTVDGGRKVTILVARDAASDVAGLGSVRGQIGLESAKHLLSIRQLTLPFAPKALPKLH
jgi:hypothetical protein